MKEHAKPSEAAAEAVKNHRFGAPLSLCAVPNANAPTLTAINTKRREIGRKPRGLLTSGERPISPNAPSARPCSERSQELPLPEFHRPAVMAQAPAASASTLMSQMEFASGFNISRFIAADIASRMPHKASNHQPLR
jgi:hypothetical protein